MFGNKMHKVEKAIEKNKGDVLVGLLTDKDEAVRLAAIDVLGKTRSNEGTNSLINLLHDPSAEVRKHAALALGAIGEAHAKAHINFACEKETDPAAKAAMQQAMNMLKNY